MNITDPISLQVFLWLSAAVLIALIICVGVIGHRAAEAWEERSKSHTESDKSLVRVAEANARQAEMVYQKALLERVGETPVITVTLPQEELDRLARNYVTQRLSALHVNVEV